MLLYMVEVASFQLVAQATPESRAVKTEFVIPKIPLKVKKW